MSKSSMQNLRRVSQYAIFPGTLTPDATAQNRAELSELNRRYWHVIAQYMTVFLVMSVICAFALYEASVDLSVLTEYVGAVILSFRLLTLSIAAADGPILLSS